MRHRELDRARVHLLRPRGGATGEVDARLRPSADLDLLPREVDAAAERLADRLLAGEAACDREGGACAPRRRAGRAEPAPEQGPRAGAARRAAARGALRPAQAQADEAGQGRRRAETGAEEAPRRDEEAQATAVIRP